MRKYIPIAIVAVVAIAAAAALQINRQQAPIEATLPSSNQGTTSPQQRVADYCRQAREQFAANACQSATADEYLCSQEHLSLIEEDCLASAVIVDGEVVDASSAVVEQTEQPAE